MPYEYVSHPADVVIKGQARTLEDVFIEVSHALVNVMYDSDDIRPIVSFSLEVYAENIEWLLVEFMNELLSCAGRKKIFMRPVDAVKITKEKNEYSACAYVSGEPLAMRPHEVKTEVKGATYSGLRVSEGLEGYAYQVLVDV